MCSEKLTLVREFASVLMFYAYLLYLFIVINEEKLLLRHICEKVMDEFPVVGATSKEGNILLTVQNLHLHLVDSSQRLHNIGR